MIFKCIIYFLSVCYDACLCASTVISNDALPIAKDCPQAVQKLNQEGGNSLCVDLQIEDLSEEETGDRRQHLTNAVGIDPSYARETDGSLLTTVHDSIECEKHIQHAIQNLRESLDLQYEQNQYSSAFRQEMQAALASQCVAHKLVDIARSASYEHAAIVLFVIMSPTGLGGEALRDAIFLMRNAQSRVCMYSAMMEEHLLKRQKCALCQDSDCLSKDHLLKTVNIIRTSLLNDGGTLPATVFTETYPNFKFLLGLSGISEWIAVLKDMLGLLTLLPIHNEQHVEYESEEKRFAATAFLKQKRESFLATVLESKENKRPLDYAAANGVAFALFWLTYLRHRDSCYFFQESLHTDRQRFEELISSHLGRSLLVPTRKVCLSVLPKSLRPDDDRAWQGAFLWEEACPMHKGAMLISYTYNFSHMFMEGCLIFTPLFWLYCLTKVFSYDEKSYMLTGDPSRIQDSISYEWFEKRVDKYLGVISSEELDFNSGNCADNIGCILTVFRRPSGLRLNLMYSFKEVTRRMYDQCMSALQLPFWSLKSLEESEDIPLEQQKKNKMAIMVSEQYMRYFVLKTILTPSVACSEDVGLILGWSLSNRFSGGQSFFKGFGRALASMPFIEASKFINLSAESPLFPVQEYTFEIEKDLCEEFEEFRKCVAPIFQEFILDDFIDNIEEENLNFDLLWRVLRNHSMNLKVENQRLTELSRPIQYSLKYLIFKRELPQDVPKEIFFFEEEPTSKKEQAEFLAEQLKQYLLSFLYLSPDEATHGSVPSFLEKKSTHIQQYFKLKQFYDSRV